MIEIPIKTEQRTYSIHIERGILDKVENYFPTSLAPKTVVIISDQNVYARYGKRLERSINNMGLVVQPIVFPAGEQSKSMHMAMDIYRQCMDAGITRQDCILTLGGGVTGDLGGFVASTYLRGIPFIQIPTTIIAQVDSSIGGKVAINVCGRKNQVGSFYQPHGVWIDPDLLRTLPKRFIRDGMGEVIKYGCIREERLITQLEALDEQRIYSHWEEIIATCCRIKGEIVQHDAYDRGERQLLNFGHTLGHAVEGAGQFQSYTHGESVAIGMSLLTAQTETLHLTEAGVTERLRQLLQQYHLPITTDIPWEKMTPFLQQDKKRRGDKITLVVLSRMGQAVLYPVLFSAVGIYLKGTAI
ncbi:3-dehydroquinate synthase [Megasphaera hutchinsoni]|nr:3-dehydroquinate synthase [Megasphaera hutchinsoni]